MKIPIDDNTFDAVYAIEATCHAPDAVSFLNWLDIFVDVCFWFNAWILLQFIAFEI